MSGVILAVCHLTAGWRSDVWNICAKCWDVQRSSSFSLLRQMKGKLLRGDAAMRRIRFKPNQRLCFRNSDAELQASCV